MWQNRRSLELEILDLGLDHYTPEEYNRCLYLLGRINGALGGFRATRKAFEGSVNAPESILEVGCGGGYLCHRLHCWFPEADILGIDICPEAIGHATDHLPKGYNGKVSFRVQKDKTLEYADGSFSVVTTMLVCHHMTDDELVNFLKECYRISSQAVVINDLHRHFLAYVGFSLLTPVLFPNRLIWHDGRLSVKRAFRKGDWIALLKRAGFSESQYVLRWNWAFRWTLTLVKS